MIDIPNPDNKRFCLNLGCGNNIKKSDDHLNWINVDIRGVKGIDHEVNAGKSLPFGNGVFRIVYACHLLEHFPMVDTESIVTEMVRITKKGGEVFIAVPDVLVISEAFVKGDLGKGAVMNYLYGGQGHEFNFHKAGFCDSSLRDLMRKRGLRKLDIWKGNRDDASNSKYSLNLKGTKI